MSKSLSSLFCKEQLWANRSRRSLKNSDVSDSLLLLLKNDRFALIRSFHQVLDSFSLLFPFLCPRVNRSRRSSLRCSFLKSDGSNSLFSTSESLFHSFAHKKRAIRSKNLRANSQPWRKQNPHLHGRGTMYMILRALNGLFSWSYYVHK